MFFFITFVDKLQSRHYKMDNEIEHVGVVDKIFEDHIRVQILQQSACSGCHAKGACSSADMDDKFVDIQSTDISKYNIGDVVMIYGKTSMGMLAVLLAFVIPFLLILVELIVFGKYMANETLAGLFALGSLVPYYFILSLFKNSLSKKLKFQIR